MKTPIFDIAIALVQRDGQWLVARRSLNAHLGGLWEFPGGKCRPNESHSDAALRELREECGVIASAQRSLAQVTFEYPDRTVLITPVICQWRSGEALPLASSACRWVTARELAGLPMPPANVDIIRELIATE